MFIFRMDKLKQVLSGSDSPDEERSGIIPQVIII